MAGALVHTITTGGGNANMRLRITATVTGSNAVTVSKIEGCRTDGYNSFASGATVIVNGTSRGTGTAKFNSAGDPSSSGAYTGVTFPKNSGWTTIWSGSISVTASITVTFGNTTVTQLKNSSFKLTIPIVSMTFKTSTGVSSFTGSGYYCKNE